MALCFGVFIEHEFYIIIGQYQISQQLNEWEFDWALISEECVESMRNHFGGI